MANGGNDPASDGDTGRTLSDYRSLAGGPAPKASLAAVTANLITAGLGVGILSLPWAMAGASLLPSIAVTLLVMALNAATIMILVQAAERYQAFDLGSLLSRLPGCWGQGLQVVCNAFTFVSVFLCLTGYVVVVADSLEPFFDKLLGQGSAPPGGLTPVRLALLALGALGALPLCFLDQRRLSFTSTLGIGTNVYLFFVVIGLFADQGVAADCCVWGASAGTITMFSSLMQCAIIQMCVLPMYEELENRSPRRFLCAVWIAFVFLAALFSLFASAAYLAFGARVQANVIQDLPGNAFGNVARVGMVVSVLAVYPLILTSMTAPVRHWEEARAKGDHSVSRWMTVVVVAGSAASACGFGQLGTLNQLNGALQVGCFIGLVPGFAGLFLLDRHTICWRFAMVSLIVGSAVASFLGLVYTNNSTEDLAAACRWFAAQAG